MGLKFEIRHKEILRKNIQVLASKKSKCYFTFQTKEWWKLDKYVIFWTDKGKSIIKYLGKGKQCECDIPEKIMEKNLFSIQVYADDEHTTQKLKIGAIPEGYTISTPQKCKKKKKKYNNDDPEVILYNVFSRLETKIDNIVYEGGYLKCYGDKVLLCQTPIFKSITNEIRENIKDMMPHFEVNDDGDIYAIYPYEK